MKKTLSLFFLIVILGLVAFWETAETKHGFTPTFREGEDTLEVSNEVETDSTLEYMKEETEVENGYRIETYREYEIYTDKEGNIIKREPTSNYNYLRYKLEQE
ncbi:MULTISPECIES: hypothetical protein [Virgibacillus]|uniref:Uncharacterized protein n=2 Tax=Virgibacillus TaxID=84406 RepID=A0A024Q816_9BACI|nr:MULTISPECIES: hypothetical protein [Virgibacillus]EQB37841.1 hypothetical protein M948_04565 [Virgibacillus sp. CM-4]MYL40571.1 hypothetical protein [Virgibacillus massiliensis]GGJ57843.1 hypothetical protein GCM10007111_19870 [Virgibacillus kapii]CDQ38634.1 hypothetical protein BN990_00906 [Virgibacillus massiliensis]